MDNLQLKNNY